MAEESQTLLAFSWTYSDGSTAIFVYVAMPFGWGPAAYVFFLYFKPFISRWREMGMCASIWIDDGIIAAADYNTCLNYRNIVQDDLRNAGWKWNNKSDWNIRQTDEYSSLLYLQLKLKS